MAHKSHRRLWCRKETLESPLCSPPWGHGPAYLCRLAAYNSDFCVKVYLTSASSCHTTLMVSTWLFYSEIFVLFWILVSGIEFFLINFIFFWFFQVGWAVVSWKVFNPETTLLSYNTSFIHVYEVSTRYTAFTSWAYFTSYAWKVSMRMCICYYENIVSDRMSVGGWWL